MILKPHFGFAIERFYHPSQTQKKPRRFSIFKFKETHTMDHHQQDQQSTVEIRLLCKI